jgi:hypothetical protein
VPRKGGTPGEGWGEIGERGRSWSVGFRAVGKKSVYSGRGGTRAPARRDKHGRNREPPSGAGQKAGAECEGSRLGGGAGPRATMSALVSVCVAMRDEGRRESRRYGAQGPWKKGRRAVMKDIC